MSLYGTGRREGCLAAATLAAFALGAHGLAGALSGASAGAALTAALANGAPAALAGVWMYRCLRAMGRSRYAALLGGAGYALAPWLQAIALVPREQWAAALAPLALEAAWRCRRPDHRRRFLPWAPLLLAAPFLSGPSFVALFTAGIAVLQLGAAARAGDLGERLGLLVRFAAVTVLAALVALSCWQIDAFGPWLDRIDIARPAAVLAAHRPTAAGTDLPALLRLGGPVLLLFAALGVLRRQRLARLRWWLPLALGGVLPTVLKQWHWLPAYGRWHDLPAAGWWLPLLAVTVLGAAGLDDFLDQPQRRRGALPWLLATAAIGGPLLPLVAVAPEREWPLVTAVCLLAMLLPCWRRIGILRFKNTLSAAALLALLIPALQVLPTVATTAGWSAAPGGELAQGTAALRRQYWALASRPPWHYAGFLLALAWAGCGVRSAVRRSHQASHTPTRAKAAIVKNARAAERS